MALPDTPQRLIREAERLGAAGELTAAIALYQQLLGRWPHFADSWYNLGLLQRRAGQFEAALAAYAQALAHGISEPQEVHLNRAVILTDHLRRDAEAEQELRQALRLAPDYLPALMNLANLHSDRGERAPAAATYERILERHPHAYEALARYAQLREFMHPEDPLILRLQAARARPDATAAQRAALGFALARALDAAGSYGAAFAAARTANADSRASTQPPARYERGALEAFVEALLSAFPERAAAPLPAAPAAGAQPIFICGMFRSGSTLAEHLLAADARVAPAGELDLLPRLVQTHLMPFPQALARTPQAALVQLAQDYGATLQRLFPQAGWVTDKRPDNFFYIGLIKALFPDARIVHTTRDALDTCLSIYFLPLDPQISYALDLDDIGHYFRQYRRLMAHWQALYGEDIFDLSYDTLVREPRPTAQRLFEFCGLPWKDSHLDFAARPASIKTASVWQVREGLYRRASGRARHYGAELASLAAELHADEGS
jgi:tetratricopeptide (TPR) repeat protein